MLYFSELEGRQVVTEDKIEMGRLEDIIFTVSANPKVSKLVIRTTKDKKTIVPYEYVIKFGDIITLKKSYMLSELDENEMYIKKNLLDKQIIDIGGNKVVRVNDVTFQEKYTPTVNELFITGVDVGILGLLRRLGVESFVERIYHFFRLTLSSSFLPWGDVQPLELNRGQVKLKKSEEKIQNMRPEDLADYLEKTNEKNVRKFLHILDKQFAAEVIENLNINYQRDLFLHWDSEKSAEILESINPEEAVDILLALHKKRRDEILSKIKPDIRNELEALINLSKTPIGKIITSEYFTVPPNITAGEVITKIKKETASYSFFAAIYVINDNKQLIGVFNPHDLLMQEHTTPVYKFMIQNLVEIRLTTPVEIAVRKMLRYRFPALPIVDNDKHLLGLLTFDHITDFLRDRI